MIELNEERIWLERLYSASPGYFALTAFNGGRPVRTKWFATSELDQAHKTIEQTREKADIYLSVATHIEPQPTRGGADTVISIPGYWADLDIGTLGHRPASLPNPETEEQALALLDGLPEPSMLLHSGGGLQAFWLFDKPWIFEPGDQVPRLAIEQWADGLEARGKAAGVHVDRVADLARILRAPGSLNRKTEPYRPVQVRWTDRGTIERSSVDADASDVDLAGEKSPTRSSNKVSDHAAIDKGDLPLSWDEILKPHGYIQCSRNTWVRPEKDCSEGHSLSVDDDMPWLITNYSESDPILDHRPGFRRYSKARLFKTLNPGVPLPVNGEIPNNWGQALDWTELLSGELPDPEWLVEPLLEEGHQIAIYSQPKTGKSLLMLDVVAGLAAGKPVLGNPAREPISIVYVDQENGRRDIREHLTNMGYTDKDLVNLHYYSFPSLAMLDTEEGGKQLYAVASYHRAKLVVLDTLSRVVEGRENENDTYHNLYRNTGVRLKADGIAVIRLDHAGKDDDKGMRGASAKASDVDSVWWLSTVGTDQLVLTRTHQRMAHGNSRIPITRADNPLRHEVEDWLDQQLKDPVDDIVRQLDFDEVDVDMGWKPIYTKYGKLKSWSQSQVQEAVKRRRN
jgi:hypothetical protein